MLNLTTLVASSLIGIALPIPLPVAPPPPVNQQVAIRTVSAEPISEPRFICKGCNNNENLTLKLLQDRGIRDKNALATIMGNIKQESTFVPNICEGGSRTSYHGCRSGGYGLIQWTSSDRYHGLGYHAARVGGDASSLETQLDYLFTEPQWRSIERHMKTPGRTIREYMNTTYRWIGWGVEGLRTQFAYDYAKRFTLEA